MEEGGVLMAIDQVFLKKLKSLKPEWVEPTPCPNCGNYRLDFNGSYECPQPRFCKDAWDDKLQLNHSGRMMILATLTDDKIKDRLLKAAL